MNPKIISVDFDGTLCENKWPEIGKPNIKLIEYLKTEREQGTKIILWTCRVNDTLAKAVIWCKKHGLEFDAVNENIPEILKAFDAESRKIFANEYIDDRNSSYHIGDCDKRQL